MVSAQLNQVDPAAPMVNLIWLRATRRAQGDIHQRPNYLLDPDLPVLLQSNFQHRQLERDLLVADSEVSRRSQLKVSPVNEVLMSVAAEEKVPDVGLQTPCTTPADGSNQYGFRSH